MNRPEFSVDGFVWFLRRQGGVLQGVVVAGFGANAVRLQLHALAYSFASFVRTLTLPKAIENWSLTSLGQRLIKTGTSIVRHGLYTLFQMAGTALPRSVFVGIIARINVRCGPPAMAASA